MNIRKFNEMSVVETVEIEAKNPSILVGVPDVGLVGPIATSHIIQSLNMKEVGYIESDILPPVVVVHENEPKHQIRVFGLGELLAVITETILPPQVIYDLSKTITLWAKQLNAKLVIGLTGMAVPNRLEIEKPAVYGIGSTDEARKILQEAKIQPFEEGILVGIYALLIRECMKEKQPNITLLAEAHLQFPDPGAAASTIESLNNLLSINVDVKSLLEKEEEIRIKARELMRRTREQMRSLQKVQEQELRGIYV